MNSVFFKRQIQPQTFSSRLPQANCSVLFAPPNGPRWHHGCIRSPIRPSEWINRDLDPRRRGKIFRQTHPNHSQGFVQRSCWPPIHTQYRPLANRVPEGFLEASNRLSSQRFDAYRARLRSVLKGDQRVISFFVCNWIIVMQISKVNKNRML
jgi:hypothetical protein